MAKALGAWPRPWGLGQGRVGVAKAVEAFPRSWARGQGVEGVVKAVGRCKGLGGVVNAVRDNANPNPKAVGA